MKILSFLISLIWFQSLVAAPITPKDAIKMVNENKAVFVDVRELEEIRGKLKGAIILPLSLINTDAFEEMIQSLPTDKSLILYCRTGRRANSMGVELEKRGYKVFNLGAFEIARNAGIPISY